jgi:hypothetical protein
MSAVMERKVKNRKSGFGLSKAKKFRVAGLPEGSVKTVVAVNPLKSMEETLMKKMFSVLLVALIALAIGAPAQASFDDAGLVRVVYRTDGTVELGTSLGQVRDLIAGTNLTAGAGATLGLDLTDFGVGANYANLRVAYLAFDTSTGETWVSSRVTPTSGATGAFDGFQRDITYIQGYYRQLTGGSAPDPVQVIGDKGNPNADWNRFNSGGFTTGGYNGFITAGTGEETLANLSNVGGFVDLGFFKWDYEEYNASGDLVATIRTALGTDGFGQTIINPGGGPAVPVPAAVWLFGTGLVGLVGIRRRKN